MIRFGVLDIINEFNSFVNEFNICILVNLLVH